MCIQNVVNFCEIFFLLVDYISQLVFKRRMRNIILRFNVRRRAVGALELHVDVVHSINVQCLQRTTKGAFILTFGEQRPNLFVRFIKSAYHLSTIATANDVSLVFVFHIFISFLHFLFNLSSFILFCILRAQLMRKSTVMSKQLFQFTYHITFFDGCTVRKKVAYLIFSLTREKHFYSLWSS